VHYCLQVGATDSEDEADAAEDLERIEAAAAAISQRLAQSPAAQPQQEIQVRSFQAFATVPLVCHSCMYVFCPVYSTQLPISW